MAGWLLAYRGLLVVGLVVTLAIIHYALDHRENRAVGPLLVVVVGAVGVADGER